MYPKKKILILIDWFAPGYKAGGPIQSCVNFCKALHNQYDIYVLTTDTDHGETEAYKDIVPDKWLDKPELGVHIYYADKSQLSAAQLASQINAVAADFIYLNHLFSPYFVVYPLWLKFRGSVAGKVVVCPRGALYDSALSLKSYKKKPLLMLYNWLGIYKKITFHATNQREQLAIEKYFKGSEIVVADNLPDTNQAPFLTCDKQPGKLSCIFLARIVPIKNLLFVLRILKNATGQVSLTIAGPAENDLYWEECKKMIAQMPEKVSINYTGAIAKEQILALLQQHHLFVLPTTGENFGHSILEAMSAGRPVLISDQTPWLQLQQQNAGWDISLTKQEEFEAVIAQMTANNQEQFDLVAKGAWKFAADFINNTAAKDQYFQLFK